MAAQHWSGLNISTTETPLRRAASMPNLANTKVENISADKVSMDDNEVAGAKRGHQSAVAVDKHYSGHVQQQQQHLQERYCELCSRLFPTVAELISHQLSRGHQYGCGHCGRWFERFGQLREHQLGEIDEQKKEKKKKEAENESKEGYKSALHFCCENCYAEAAKQELIFKSSNSSSEQIQTISHHSYERHTSTHYHFQHLGEYLFHEYHHYHRNERLYVKVERWKMTKSSCEDNNEEEKEDKEKEKDEETEVAAEETKTDKDDDDDDDMELSESEKELKIQSLGALIARKEVELLELMQRKLKWFEENASELLDKIKAWEEANQDNINNNSDNDNTEEQQQQQSSQPATPTPTPSSLAVETDSSTDNYHHNSATSGSPYSPDSDFEMPADQWRVRSSEASSSFQTPEAQQEFFASLAFLPSPLSAEDSTVDQFQFQYQSSTTTTTETEEEDLATTVFDSDTRVLDMDISEEGDKEEEENEEKDEEKEEEKVAEMAEVAEEQQSLISIEKSVNVCHRCGESFPSYSKLKSHLTENWISSLGKETCRCCSCRNRTTVNSTVVNTDI